MNPPTSTKDADKTKENGSSSAVEAGDQKEMSVTEESTSASGNEVDKKLAGEDPNSQAGTDTEDKNRTPSGTASDHGDGNDDSSAGSSSSDEEKEKDKSTEYFTEDGRKLSEYEIQRLERIKRNREYLAKLGLEGKDGSGVLGQKERRKRSKKPNEVPQVVRRSPISRRSKTKKVAIYAEPSSSVRDLLRVADRKATNAPVDLNIPSPDRAELSLQPPKQPPENKRKPKKSFNERQEAFIYLEFKRIQSSKNQLVKQAGRNVRLAEKEVKYWHKLVGRWERRNRKQIEAEQQRQIDAKERVVLGGKSIMELLQELDGRFPEINAAVRRYDNCLQAQARQEYADALRAEAQEKMKMLDALDQFPKAMKNAVSLLDTIFLERATKDLPAPRRTRRSVFDEDPESKHSLEKKVMAQGKQKSDSPVASSDESRMHEDATYAAESNAGREREKAKAIVKQRKKVKNVGGWISPEFSEEIDRSWLSGDAPTKQFDVSKYVPQVGDTVLYYISGHKTFLAEYPDVLAKKAKLTSRVPLWKRAAQICEGGAGAAPEKAEAACAWWTEGWLKGLESSGFSDYPLLCRVERTDIEFPPDPFSKIVKNDEGATKIYFKKPRNVTVDKAVAQLRMAVGLQPLTPLDMPSHGDGPQPTQLPPFFSVVIFPSKNCEPFLVPFGWAYVHAHSLTLNQKVQIRPGQDKTQYRIDEFASLSDGRNLRLEENEGPIKKTLRHFDSARSNTAALEELLKQQPLGTVPLRDALVVLDVWTRRFNGPLFEHESSSSEATPFVDLVRRTLPLWKSVKLMRNMYDRQQTRVSPWQVVAPGREREMSSPWFLGEHSYSIDEPLRVKIELLLGEIVSEHQAAADTFLEPVTEDIAPSYFCAVPLSMSLSRILQRLKLNGPGSSKTCFYRTVDAVLSDVASILDNCLLYNNPEAEVVGEAANLVALIEERIGKVTNEHHHELKEARKIGDQRPVLQRSESIGTLQTPRSTATVLDSLRKPFKEPLNREWLELIRRGPGESHSPSSVRSAVDSNDTSAVVFCPQAGDTVLYSLALHQRFVDGHYSSLEADQCLLPSLESSNDAAPPSQGESQSEYRSTEWTKGEIIWARSAFPKIKQSKEGSNTFSTKSTLRALGIQFQGSSVVSTVYWRPCLFYFDETRAEGVCSGCGLSANESFLRAVSGTGDAFVAENSLSTSRRLSICSCIDLLKRRCLKRTPPAFVDPQLTKENVKVGYTVPLAKVGKSSLPVLTQLFESCDPTPAVSHHGTRGASLKSARENPEIDTLKDAGFVPIWASSQANGTIDDSLLRKAGTILATPKLCLEQILLRLRNNYYRRPAAIENDLAEAYLCTAILMLAEAVTRKRSPVSMRRVARALSSRNDMISDDDHIDSTLKEEEAEWARRLRLVRELYAAALVSVSDTVHAERVFGLAESLQSKPVYKKAEDPNPDRAAARKKIDYILRAIGRDECLNSFGDAKEWGMPTMKLIITCGGEPFSYDSRYFSARSSPLQAKIYDNLFDVKVICGGEPAFFGNVSLFENISSNVRKQNYAVAPPIFFGPEIYEKNNSLSTLFFRRNGRAHACARCQAHKRSMVACRVARRHSNFDFDWLTWIPGGTSHIDELLRTLQSLNGDPIEETSASTSTAAEDEKNADSNAGEDKSLSKDDANDAGDDDGQYNDDNDVDADDGEDDGDNDETISKKVAETKFGDPRAFSNKAELALQLSREVLAEITPFSEAPIRLSKEFIEKEFPVDEDDGHYLYCVICGLSGNLLCCDGCPIVVHPDCVGLADLPEGDWYCEECNVNKTADPRNRVSGKDAEHGTHIAFDRLEYDASKLDRVTALLDELRSSRPTHRMKKKTTENDDDDDDDDALIEELSSKFRRKRLRRPSNVENCYFDDEEEHHPPKRRRSQTDQYLAVSSSPRLQTINRTSLEEKRKKAAEFSGINLKIRGRKTKNIDNPFEILSATQKEFLRSIGIKTAGDFLATRTTDIAPKFVVWRRKKGLSKLKGSGPTASVSAWKTSVRNAAEEMALESDGSDSDSESEEDEETIESANVEIGGEDPLEALSATAKSFLESIGITTAVAFLSQRSSDIAPHFVEWRAEEGMSELKGSGPVATVSAWKTVVKNRAKEMGLDRVAEMEPATQNRQSTTPRTKPVKRHHASATPQTKPAKRQHASATPQKKPAKHQHDSATPQKKPAMRQHASATPQTKPAKRQRASATPQKKLVKRQRASATPQKKLAKRPHVKSTERPSQRNSVKRARRTHVHRNAVESKGNSENEEENLDGEESNNSSAKGRRTRRKSRPPRRFIDIQESLVLGKASKTDKDARTKP